MPDLPVSVSGNTGLLISHDGFADYVYAGVALYPGALETVHYHCRCHQLTLTAINKKALI